MNRTLYAVVVGAMVATVFTVALMGTHLVLQATYSSETYLICWVSGFVCSLIAVLVAPYFVRTAQ